jgi:hypothetical protein
MPDLIHAVQTPSYEVMMRESASNSHFWEEQIGSSQRAARRRYSLLQLMLDVNPPHYSARLYLTKPQFLSRCVVRVFFFVFFSDCSNRRDEYDI